MTRWQRLRRAAVDHADRGLLAGAALALAATLFDPSWRAERARFDHVVVLDITQSMNVLDESIDGRPVSRLAYAKHALREALLRLPCGSKVGWAVFTEYRSFLLFAPVEVCANLSELRSTLAAIDGRMAWTGNSEVAKALHSAIGIVKALPERPSLVFVSDGHEAPPLNPRYRPAFDDKPGDASGVVVGVGGLQPAPIPKIGPAGERLGFWGADEVMQTDPRSLGRGGSVAGEREVDEGGGAGGTALPLGATPGAEHLSAQHEGYLRLLAGELGFGFHRLQAVPALGDALTAPALARPTPVRADGRALFAGVALVLLLARHALSWGRRPGISKS